MKRLYLAIAVASLIVAIPSPVAAGGTTCDYNPTTRRVDVQIMDSSVHLARQANGNIVVGGSWCDGVATVFNTDLIYVTGNAHEQQLFVQLANGGFRPGFTNEAGKSDEIEMVLNLGGEADEVLIRGTDGVQNIVLGQTISGLLLTRRINLNAGESTGVDADISLISVERVTVETYGGNDKIRAQGGLGTGNVWSQPFWAYAGSGNDVVKGGSAGDYLTADAGSDTVWGYGGPDNIYLSDGVKGNDVGHGGPGADYCAKDLNDTCD